MKKNNLFNMANKLISIIIITFIVFSCNSKVDSSKDKDLDNDSNISSDCNIHNKDCEQIAKDLGMTIEEYHIWDKNQQSEIEMEDEMTDENGDIIDPNSSNQNGPQKQWVNCKHCHGTGYWKCTQCDGTGKLELQSCDYCGRDGCSKCDWTGNKKCYYCEGKGNNGDCTICEGRGQVLIEY